MRSNTAVTKISFTFKDLREFGCTHRLGRSLVASALGRGLLTSW